MAPQCVTGYVWQKDGNDEKWRQDGSPEPLAKFGESGEQIEWILYEEGDQHW